jgi:DNA-binding NarL/FixJ family response regulator
VLLLNALCIVMNRLSVELFDSPRPHRSATDDSLKTTEAESQMNSQMVPDLADTDTNGLLEKARVAFANRDWLRARDTFNATREQHDCTADDLLALADASWWLGQMDEALSASEEAHRRFLDDGNFYLAALAALRIGHDLTLQGEAVIGSGWISRAARLLEDQPESVEHGVLRYLDAESGLRAGDCETALEKARVLREMGRQHENANLLALSLAMEGRALIQQGDLQGMTLLDDAMLAALADDLEPVWTGNVYCHVMEACTELGDIARATQWTAATADWCDGLAAIGPFWGLCRLHRAEALQIRGDWTAAQQEAERVCDATSGDAGSAAEAHYRVGEIRRLRGDLGGAEEAFLQSHRLGRDPQPGLALQRLAMGQIDAAMASIQAALSGEGRNRISHGRLSAASVEIALAAGAFHEARLACDELDETARRFGSGGLEALALQAKGALLLAQEQAADALRNLRAAFVCWQELGDSYEAARCRVLLAKAYRGLSDEDAAMRELEAAVAEFERLGAFPDLKYVWQLQGESRHPDGLTAREIEVATLVASGITNREIADSLSISDKTVARHLSNIFGKLRLSSRTALASYAIEKGLSSQQNGSN